MAQVAEQSINKQSFLPFDVYPAVLVHLNGDHYLEIARYLREVQDIARSASGRSAGTSILASARGLRAGADRLQVPQSWRADRAPAKAGQGS